ncbi:MAG: NifB/NifX family molybdenum-iron cluster-binding protein [Deltaproteobacteria bacterium]|jgi:predicted Fe-Mo cluster-binding NifX family protein|nr:NifB/NifX family molybdenum-iron cluster-binding protein [Deltaproteobacteria bacterium]
MKIAVSSSGMDLDAQIDPRFGRCACFVIVETDDMTFEAYDNESIALGGGAGIQAAQFVASKGARGVITGNCGPNAVRTLSASQVDVFLGQSGTIREAVERYARGDMSSSSTPNVADHYGMGSGGGMGRGMGMGMGRGMGMGMGRGMGMGSGMSGSNLGSRTRPESTRLSKEEELKRLKDQAEALRKQMASIESGIRDLEKG